MQLILSRDLAMFNLAGIICQHFGEFSLSIGREKLLIAKSLSFVYYAAIEEKQAKVHYHSEGDLNLFLGGVCKLCH